MLRLKEQIRRVAPADANVLITGESGTRKELVARSIHAQSARAKRPFVAVDCAALPEGLLETELLGHERGAFTGAVARREGLFYAANHGTVFLDEVGELAQGLQSKLLRTLDQQQIRRVGDAQLTDLDIRVVAATNREPEAAVREGVLREDLYYRLNVVHLRLVPPRERENDLALLLNLFLDEVAASNGKDVPRIRADALKAMERYPWPGNVRELRNVAQRVVVLDDDGVITAADLPDSVRLWAGRDTGEWAAASFTYATARAIAQRKFQLRIEYLTRLLAAHDGKITRAAAAEASRRTLHR